jgi:hypothetical protein
VLLRLLDAALAAHGRDNGYRVQTWREQVATVASAAAAWIGDHDDDTWPLPAAIDRTAGSIARALTALGRDRVGVLERLVAAARELLVVYAAACEAEPRTRRTRISVERTWRGSAACPGAAGLWDEEVRAGVKARDAVAIALVDLLGEVRRVALVDPEAATDALYVRAQEDACAASGPRTRPRLPAAAGCGACASPAATDAAIRPGQLRDTPCQRTDPARSPLAPPLRTTRSGSAQRSKLALRIGAWLTVRSRAPP